MYTYAKTEVRNSKPSKKYLKNLKKSHAKQLASSWQKSLLTSKTNTYLAETRPKRTSTTTQGNNISQNKVFSNRLLKKAVAISCGTGGGGGGGGGSPQKSALGVSLNGEKSGRKTMSRSNLIENELMKYRKQAEKMEAEAQRILKGAKEKKEKKIKICKMGEIGNDMVTIGRDDVAANKCKILCFFGCY